jgi:hypothetical protein
MKVNKMGIEPDEYYIDAESGFMVFTAKYLLKQGECCGNKCRHCPYLPKYVKGNKVTKNKIK